LSVPSIFGLVFPVSTESDSNTANDIPIDVDAASNADVEHGNNHHWNTRHDDVNEDEHTSGEERANGRYQQPY
jgi:hypothetical protein